MSERTKHRIATGAAVLVLMTPMVGHAGTSLSARVGDRIAGGVTLALAGQHLLTERQKQTHGLEAERRVLSPGGRA